jgi:hypothetical protein
VVGKVIDSVLGKSHASAGDRAADLADALHLPGHHAATGAAVQSGEHHETQVGEGRGGGGGGGEGDSGCGSGILRACCQAQVPLMSHLGHADCSTRCCAIVLDTG